MAMMKFAKKEQSKSNFFSTCKVLIVDDEVEVHSVTKAVLSQFVFEGKKLELLSAYNGAEAIEILKKHNDIGLIHLKAYNFIIVSTYALYYFFIENKYTTITRL